MTAINPIRSGRQSDAARNPGEPLANRGSAPKSGSRAPDLYAPAGKAILPQPEAQKETAFRPGGAVPLATGYRLQPTSLTALRASFAGLCAGSTQPCGFPL